MENLWRFLSQGEEKANEDMALQYFRHLFPPPNFKRQSEASGADGYVQGHFVLELKGKKEDWLKGLMQALAYKQSLNFSCVVVIAKQFFAIWNINDLPEKLLEDIGKATGPANEIGKNLATKYHNDAQLLLKNALWQYNFKPQASTLDDFYAGLKFFESTLFAQKRVRQKITIKNFISILPQMAPYFSSKIKAVRAFYGMLYGWDENSTLEISHKYHDKATLKGEVIEHLLPEKRLAFKDFVEHFYICLSKDEHYEDFFACYDKALDKVDRKFRIKNGIFFTDLDLAKFALWNVKQKFPNLGNDYLVIDPACGSGNLVTSWRSPLDLRHKVVSEIEPELLYTVENRMKGDVWHQGKYTIVPKTEEGRGLNFLDISAQEYLDILGKYLENNKQKPDKPLAFLCNPPYRGNDNQKADLPEYEIHPSITELIGEDAKAERYNCFLAQMKLICQYAKERGVPKNSLLLLFTATGWLTKRPSFQKIRHTMFSHFDFVDGFLINSTQFFDIKGKFPVAFTMWAYKGENAKLNPNRSIQLQDLTWVRKEDLNNIPWGKLQEENQVIHNLITDTRAIHVPYGLKRHTIKSWISKAMLDFKRDRRKDEIHLQNVGGLPLKDYRSTYKKAYGDNKGQYIGFMEDLTPCRVTKSHIGVPWFLLTSKFMDCNSVRCFSGPPTHYGYKAEDFYSAQKLFFWFSLSRIFSLYKYPMWANTSEIWAPEIPTNLQHLINQYTFAIGFADNECVETTFPANNPSLGGSKIYINNPLAPTNPDSFWSKIMSPIFQNCDTNLPGKLVKAVKALYQEWEKQFKETPEIVAYYSQPYFIETGYLKKTAGLIQIRHYAESVSHQKLLSLQEEVKQLLKENKEAFNQLLREPQHVNYFGLPSASAEDLTQKARIRSRSYYKNSHYNAPGYISRKTTKKQPPRLRKKKVVILQKKGKKAS